MKSSLVILVVVLLVVVGYAGYVYLKQDPPDPLVELVARQNPPPPLSQGEVPPLRVPEGFNATIYSRETPGARVMTRDSKGALLVSLTSQGKIVALPDLNGDGVADETKVILEGLDRPHGILVMCPEDGFLNTDQDACALYVAETGSLSVYSYDADSYRATGREELAELPTEGGGHFTRTLQLSPSGEDIYVAVGSSCNVCEEKDPARASLLSYDIKSKTLTPYATGLRNTVFMALDPVAGGLWGTDHGRDMIGDDIPPDEVNIIEKGGFYGWPYCYGNKIFDTDFNKESKTVCTDSVEPHLALLAHSAPLGLSFIPEEGYPEDMWGDLLVSYHGSWNRSIPTGYKVVRFDLDAQRRAEGGPIDFMTGFLPSGEENEDNAIGRPADVLAESGGVIYVSDDKAGAIYRVAYMGD